jgi:hypothetical protein
MQEISLGRSSVRTLKPGHRDRDDSNSQEGLLAAAPTGFKNIEANALWLLYIEARALWLLFPHLCSAVASGQHRSEFSDVSSPCDRKKAARPGRCDCVAAM